jgi:hypothetical protein
VCNIDCHKGACHKFLQGGLELNESFDDEDNTQEVMSQIFVVNVGTRHHPGDVLVDKILNREKIVKYWGALDKCFDQWICLRERLTTSNSDGRIRCAIKIDSQPLSGLAWRREEWGWDEQKNQKNLDKGLLGRRCYASPKFAISFFRSNT